MRAAAVFFVGLVLILVQGNLFRILGPLGINGATPSLILPLIVFLGVHESSTARGALLSFLLGYALDLFAGAPIGLLTFVSVATWGIAHIAGVRLAAQTALTQMSLALVFALVQSAIILILLAIFGSDALRPLDKIASVVIPNALATALFGPVVFRIASKLHPGTLAPPRAAEGATR